jgi:hypothetical protein
MNMNIKFAVAAVLGSEDLVVVEAVAMAAHLGNVEIAGPARQIALWAEAGADAPFSMFEVEFSVEASRLDLNAVAGWEAGIMLTAVLAAGGKAASVTISDQTGIRLVTEHGVSGADAPEINGFEDCPF